jgi:DNA repair protein RadC
MKKHPQFQASPNIAEIALNYRCRVKATDRISITASNDAYLLLQSIWTDQIEYIEQFVILLLNRANKALGWVRSQLEALQDVTLIAR